MSLFFSKNITDRFLPDESRIETYHRRYILKVHLRMNTRKIPTDDQTLSFIFTVVIQDKKYFIAGEKICTILVPVADHLCPGQYCN